MNIMDVKIMAIAGIAGVLFKVLKFNSAAMILAWCWHHLRGQLLPRIHHCTGNVFDMFNKPIAGIIMLVCIVALLYPMVAPLIKNLKDKKAAAK